MIGILLLVLFEIIGIGISLFVLKNESLHINIWLGLVLGIVFFMWLPIIYSFHFGFGRVCHILALFTFLLIFILIFISNGTKPFTFKVDKTSFKVSYILVFCISLLICILITSHVLKPLPNGDLAVGQSTFGDLPLHLSIASSMAVQGIVPPDYSIYPGQKLCYPFLVDSLSASLMIFKVPLRESILIPSYIFVFLLVSGFYYLSACFLKTEKSKILGLLLFFFNGGFGIIYFLDGIKSNKNNFAQIFTDFYKTPTNFADKNIKWVNIICDMLIPQRTTLAGWTFAILCIWLLYNAITFKDTKKYILAGIIAGLMPMVHTHSYLALGILSGTWFFVYYKEQDSKLSYILNWFSFGIPALLLSIPQLLYWTFNQSGSEGFVRYHFNWANGSDLWLWFWIKNVGIVFLLLIPALKYTSASLRKIGWGFFMIFFIAEFIVFQPNNYDNNKLFYIWYLYAVILVTDFICNFHNSLENKRLANILLTLTIFIGTISGTLSVCREYVSSYVLFDNETVACAQFIKNETLSDGVFLTADNHNNVVASLCGRNIFSGSPSYLAYHGIDYSARSMITEKIYKSPHNSKNLLLENKIDYIYISSYEKGKYGVEKYQLDGLFEKIYETHNIAIYAVSNKALELK